MKIIMKNNLLWCDSVVVLSKEPTGNDVCEKSKDVEYTESVDVVATLSICTRAHVLAFL
jgi:hypothetical protein